MKIELQAPDLSRWASGNTGTSYVWRFDSGRPGPQVMVQALTHGNEICGAIALDELLDCQAQWQPQRGSLTLAFGNIAAYARWDPADPDRSRYVDEDFNRVWADEALSGPRDSVELRRARELRPFVDAADLLLDIHSMRGPCTPLMVCGTTGRGGEKGAALSRQLQVPGAAAHRHRPPGRAAHDRTRHLRRPAAMPRSAVLIECGQHWERAAADVARDTLLRFLGHSGVLDAGFVAAQLQQLGRTPPPRQRLLRVTEAVVARSTGFRFVRDFRGLEVIAHAGDLIATDGTHEFRAPYDDTVLVMPGTTNLKAGMTTVRLGRYED